MSDNPYAPPGDGGCQDCAGWERKCQRLENRLEWVDRRQSWRDWLFNVFGVVFLLVVLADMVALGACGIAGLVALIKWLWVMEG